MYNEGVKCIHLMQQWLPQSIFRFLLILQNWSHVCVRQNHLSLIYYFYVLILNNYIVFIRSVTIIKEDFQKFYLTLCNQLLLIYVTYWYRHTLDLVSNHHNKGYIAIKWILSIFLFSSVYKSYVYIVFQFIKCMTAVSILYLN